MGITLKDAIGPYKREILDKLDQYKFDKVEKNKSEKNVLGPLGTECFYFENCIL
jgi:hypothetical protein